VRAGPHGLDDAAVVEMLIEAGADLAAVGGVPTGREPVDAVFRRLRPAWFAAQAR
jgi:hypothetical protein